MAKTSILPTVTAVRMAWAMSGKFSNDQTSKLMAEYAEQDLKKIEEKGAASMDIEEQSYIFSAVVTIKSCLRSLETVYKGRELNFSENEKLREAYLESVKESLDFGNKAKDFLKSLPTMTIGAAGGVTVAQALGITDEFWLWGIGLVLASIGYIINFWIVRRMRRRKQMLYVKQDYERGLYYTQYLERMKTILAGLFLDLERIHMRVFNEHYETDTSVTAVNAIVDNTLAGAGSTFCKLVHLHMKKNIVTPELWATCESGHEDAVNSCPFRHVTS